MKLPVNYEKTHFTVRKLVREEYVRLQNGDCCHCDSPLNNRPSSEIESKAINRHLFPETFFKWPVHLHHCRKTGMTIGAVHSKCNAVLWQYEGE